MVDSDDECGGQRRSLDLPTATTLGVRRDDINDNLVAKGASSGKRYRMTPSHYQYKSSYVSATVYQPTIPLFEWWTRPFSCVRCTAT